MRVVIVLAVLLFPACAEVRVPVAPLIPPARWIESTTVLPPDPAQEPIPADMPKGDFLDPISKDDPSPRDGYVLSEERAHRDALYRVRYKQIAAYYSADRSIWEAHRSLYEQMHERDVEELRKLAPTWWSQHQGTLCALGGMLLGSALTVGIVYAVSPATK